MVKMASSNFVKLAEIRKYEWKNPNSIVSIKQLCKDWEHYGLMNDTKI
jgi:phage-related protein